MKFRVLVAAIMAALLVVLTAGAAWARNPHCAGGIQYLTQALADKQKGNMDDYHREIQKAVQQLEACSTEDPADFEGIGYLGWAYGEVDSLCAAGKAFATSIAGLKSKGDKKKLDQFETNQKAFWAATYNKGIASITKAQELWNPYSKKPENDADQKSKAGSRASYDESIGHLQSALCVKAGDPQTLRSLGTVYANLGDYVTAEKYFADAHAGAPADSELADMIKQTRLGRANQLLDDKKYDEAIAYYQELIKSDKNNPDLWSGLGEAALKKSQETKDDVKKAAVCQAADAFAKAGALTPTSSELPYNAAVCYRECGDLASAEGQWNATLKVKDDCEARGNLAGVLADEKKFPEAIAAGMKALVTCPQEKTGYQQLGAIYNKAGDNTKSKQFALAFLAMRSGKPADAATAASGAAGTKVQGAMGGKPDQIVLWEADGQNYETWFYYSKGQAYHFGNGAQLEKTDWSAALASK